MELHWNQRCLTRLGLACSLAVAVGCGDGGAGEPTGPAADLSEEISGGAGPFVGSASLGQSFPGYLASEFVAAGVAESYRAVGDMTPDGRWSFELNGTTAPYRTRVLVRYPEDASAFSGTVVVEWLNVSGGLDANPDFDSLKEEIFRQGHVWVGVSAQLIGVEGGLVLVVAPGGEGLAGEGLKKIDPARYSSLEHPGDGFSFDIFTQVARALRQEIPGLGRRPQRVLAAGESQSAIALTTYYNGVQPLTEVFDGFFVHSRASVALPLVAPGQAADLPGALGGVTPIFRTDLSYPVMELQAEGDVVGILASHLVRQADSETFRLWETAGTAHADAHLLGPIADLADCGVPINDGPLHVVAKAAFHHLDIWVRDGTLPPTAPRLELNTDGEVAVQRDVDGIALGGLRTPPVDVPVEVLSGEPAPESSLLCLLLGSTTPLPSKRIAELYTSAEDYEQLYAAAADESIASGFVLQADREALLDFSDPETVGN